MKTNSFFRVLLFSSMLFVNRPSQCFIIKTYCGIFSLFGLYIFCKNPNKNFQTFAQSLGKGFLVVPGYIVIGLENTFLPVGGRSIGLLAAPIFGMKQFDYLVQRSHDRATKDLHCFVDFVFPH